MKNFTAFCASKHSMIVDFVFMQVDEKHWGVFANRIQSMLKEVPSMRIVMCSRERLVHPGLEQEDESNVYVLPAMPVSAGAQLVKKLVKELAKELAKKLAKELVQTERLMIEIDDDDACKLALNSSCNPAVSCDALTW